MGKEISTVGNIEIGKKKHIKIPIHLRYLDTEKV